MKRGLLTIAVPYARGRIRPPARLGMAVRRFLAFVPDPKLDCRPCWSSSGPAIGFHNRRPISFRVRTATSRASE